MRIPLECSGTPPWPPCFPRPTSLWKWLVISMKMTRKGNSSFISLVVFRIMAIDCGRDVWAAGRHLKAEDTNGEEKKLAFRSCHYKDLTETGNSRMKSLWYQGCVQFLLQPFLSRHATLLLIFAWRQKKWLRTRLGIFRTETDILTHKGYHAGLA